MSLQINHVFFHSSINFKISYMDKSGVGKRGWPKVSPQFNKLTFLVPNWFVEIVSLNLLLLVFQSLFKKKGENTVEEEVVRYTCERCFFFVLHTAIYIQIISSPSFILRCKVVTHPLRQNRQIGYMYQQKQTQKPSKFPLSCRSQHSTSSSR